MNIPYRHASATIKTMDTGLAKPRAIPVLADTNITMKIIFIRFVRSAISFVKMLNGCEMKLTTAIIIAGFQSKSE